VDAPTHFPSKDEYRTIDEMVAEGDDRNTVYRIPTIKIVTAGSISFAIDALSADEPGATIEEHDVHYTPLPEDILIVEGVVTLAETTAGRYDVICIPIPYENRDGSQARLPGRPR